MWNEVCSNIFSEYVGELKKQNIRYFVLRNYELLPEQNMSKDIDIIIDPKKISIAKRLLKEVYSGNGIKYYDEAIFDRMTCTHGIDLDSKTGIHIDLIGGYLARGYELYSFDELYSHTKVYKDFYVLDDYFEGVMLLIYKMFGYKKPKLKESYREKIKETYEKYGDKFERDFAKVTTQEFAKKTMQLIANNEFDKIIDNNTQMSKLLKKYAWKKSFIKALWGRIHFLWQKTDRVVIRYRKYKRVFAVLAPDGTGKTTFLDTLIDKLNYYYVSDASDNKFNVYHFRPTVLPNLGAVGEKAGVMEQDKDWTNPHRNKPANPISSFVRMVYYMADYIIGWQKCVRNDVRCDRYSIFDRYSYDFIVDPLRSRIGLPRWIRRALVRVTPQPPVVFVLQASPETIFGRKKELTKEEITRQLGEYKKIADSHKRFKIINAENTPEEMANEAIKIILEYYTEKIGK